MMDIINLGYQLFRLNNNFVELKEILNEVEKENDVIKKLRMIEKFLEKHIEILNDEQKKVLWNKYLEIGDVE